MDDKIMGCKMMGTTNHTNKHEILTTIERQGGREKEQPKVGPKGEGVGTTESNDTDEHNQAPGQVCGRLPEGSPKGETRGIERVK